MTFDEAIAQHAGSSATSVAGTSVAFAASNGARRQAIENLRTESRLIEAAWIELIHAFSAGMPLDDLHLKLVSTFRRYVLGGPQVTCPIVRLGRAITPRRYASILQSSIGITEAQAQRFITRLLSENVAFLNRSGAWTPWKPDRTVWATFDPLDPSSPPFAFATTSEEIQGRLGLDPNEREEPLLLFEYSLPFGTPALYPTVAEAYAGDGWQIFFRPAPPTAAHGLTMTWHEYAGMAPRPEIVHKGFEGRTFLSTVIQVD